METKEFPTNVVASLTTGITICDFDDMHECAEWVAGHSIWTHEFADKRLWDRLLELIFAQAPELRTLRLRVMTKEQAESAAASVCEQFGPTVTLIKGSGTRDETPLASLNRMYPDKPVIVVEA